MCAFVVRFRTIWSISTSVWNDHETTEFMLGLEL